jgi:hypothetical protein
MKKLTEEEITKFFKIYRDYFFNEEKKSIRCKYKTDYCEIWTRDYFFNEIDAFLQAVYEFCDCSTSAQKFIDCIEDLYLNVSFTRVGNKESGVEVFAAKLSEDDFIDDRINLCCEEGIIEAVKDIINERLHWYSEEDWLEYKQVNEEEEEEERDENE